MVAGVPLPPAPAAAAPPPPPTTTPNTPVAAATSMQEPAAAGGAAIPHTELPAPLPPRPSKRFHHDPGPSQLSRSLFEASQPMRGYTFSFLVRFLDPSKRTARAAATEAIKRVLCAWGDKQRHGFTLDARENGSCLEGVIEGVDNGVVSEKALATLKKRVYDHLGSGKRGLALKCNCNMSIFAAQAKPAGLPEKEQELDCQKRSPDRVRAMANHAPPGPGPPSSSLLGLLSCLRDPSLIHLSRPPRRSKGSVCCALRLRC